MNKQFLEEQKRLFSGTCFSMIYILENNRVTIYITDSLYKHVFCGMSSGNPEIVKDYLKRKLKIIALSA